MYNFLLLYVFILVCDVQILWYFTLADEGAFPLELQTCLSTRAEIKHFAEECKKMGIQYIGLCCGNSPHIMRIVTEVYGKSCPALKYAPEMHKHFLYGKKEVTNDDDYYTKNMKYNLSGRNDS